MSNTNNGRKNSSPNVREQLRQNLSSHTNLYSQFIQPTNNFLQQHDVPLVPSQAKTITKISQRVENGELNSTNAMTQSSMGFFSTGANQIKQGNYGTGFTHLLGGIMEGVFASKIISDHEGSRGQLNPVAQMKYDNDLTND